MVHKEEFIAWKSSICSIELQQELVRNIEAAAATILNRESPNGDQDQLLRGFIQGLKATLEWQPEFVKEQEEDEDEDEV